MLDATDDPAHTVRTFTFVSDGPGLVQAQIISSDGGSTKLTLMVDLNPKSLYAQTGVTPKVAGRGDTQHSIWTVTLIGMHVATPTVDVTISWPTSNPSITLAHGRFQGTPSPNSQKGFTAEFKPRGAGQLSVLAAWPGTKANAQITLANVTGAASVIDDQTFSGVSSLDPAYSTSVVPSVKYQLLLLNTSPDSDRPDLSATISFP